MFFKSMPPIEVLNEQFNFYVNVGKLYYKIDGPLRKAGEEAGVPRDAGYVYVYVRGYGSYRRCRLVWYYKTGIDPEGAEIDHENRQNSDDRISNLRLSNRSRNSVNTKLSSRNKSGIRGVWQKANGKWCAKISRGSYRKTLGQAYPTKEAAAEAYRLAELECGYEHERVT